jgi:hypothetical protein
MKAMMIRAALFSLAVASAARAQAVDEAKVDQAIKKGVEFLRGAKSPDFHNGYKNSDVLILWTFIHAAVPQDDPKFKQLLESVLSEPLEKTYKVALLAMCLEEIDRVRHQEKIAQCAQFLVDNQCKNGQWNYGNPTEFSKEVKVPAVQKAVASGDGKGAGATLAKDGKPKVLQHVAVKKMKEGPDSGDNSNTQYAALGLRACYDAGVTLPEGVIVLAVKWWRESQFKDPKKDKEKASVASGTSVSGKVEGWNYKDEALQPDKPPYHSMTAGGVGALVIYDYMLDRKWKDDSFVKGGMNWLTVHYETPAWNTYYLYGLERAAILFGTEKIGDHFWYAEGANALLGAQGADGSWGKDTDWFNTTWDTCFSVLFLRRATRALVASEDKGKLKK